MVKGKKHLWAAITVVIFFCFTVGTAKGSDIERIKIHLHKNEIAISFFSLPNGESTLIQGYRKNLLINSGDVDSQTALEAQLNKLGIKKINTMILTNPHTSYVGNVVDVVKRYDVKNIITSQKIKMVYCSKRKKNFCHLIHVFGRGIRYPISNLKTEVLDQNQQGAINVLFTYGTNTIYYMGFSNRHQQEAFFKKRPFSASIIKLSNYGHGSELTQELIKVLDPEVAVIFHKKGLQPDEDFIRDLDTEWVETYQLQTVGTLTLHMTPERYEMAAIH